MVSIPRDTLYLYVYENHIQNKITHSVEWNHVIKQLELMNIDINYYVKINFTGLVKLVDAVGGIQVDVPYSFVNK